jgi:hypothetical protein
VIDLTYSPPANVARKGNSVGADIEDAIKALNLSDKIEENDTRTEDKENRINADEAVIEEESREDDVEITVDEETRQTEASKQQQREEEEKAIAMKLALEAEERRKLGAIVADNVRRQIKEIQDAKRLAAIKAEEKAQWERMEREKAAIRCREEKQKREERSILTEKTLRAASNASHYVVLGITPTATSVQIKEAYRRLSKVLHPDKNDLPNADEAFKVVSNAYQVLQDASSRREYDREQRNVGDAGIPSQPPTSSSASPERSVFPIVVNIRFETRKILRMVGSQATLMRCKVLAMGRNYTVYYADGSSPFSKTDLIPNQFVIPNGTMVRLKYGNRDYGTIVGWTEGYDWYSNTDISYYAVRMANNVIQNVYMMNVELE